MDYNEAMNSGSSLNEVLFSQRADTCSMEVFVMGAVSFHVTTHIYPGEVEYLEIKFVFSHRHEILKMYG